jgi:hypothetical protein
LALAGMQQLSTIDSDLTARRTGDKVELLLRNQIAYSQTVDADYDAEDWGDLTADVLTEATADSEKIKSAPTEKVYEAMFSGVVGKLDQFSRYAGAQNARENRAARDGFGGIGDAFRSRTTRCASPTSCTTRRPSAWASRSTTSSRRSTASRPRASARRTWWTGCAAPPTARSTSPSSGRT